MQVNSKRAGILSVICGDVFLLASAHTDKQHPRKHSAIQTMMKDQDLCFRKITFHLDSRVWLPQGKDTVTGMRGTHTVPTASDNPDDLHLI